MIINKPGSRRRQYNTDWEYVTSHDTGVDDFRKLMEVEDEDVLNDEQRKHLLFQYVKDCLEEMTIWDADGGLNIVENQPYQMKWKLHNGPLAGCVFEAIRYHDSLNLEIHAPEDKAEWLSRNIGWITSRLSSYVKIVAIKNKDSHEHR